MSTWWPEWTPPAPCDTLIAGQRGQPLRRRETREHVTLYFKAFNAWATGSPLTQLSYTPREPVPPIAGHR